MKRLLLCLWLSLPCLLSAGNPASFTMADASFPIGGHYPFAYSTPEQEAADLIRNRLASYFQNYTNPDYENSEPTRLTYVTVDMNQHTIVLSTNDAFAMQPFTQETVSRIKEEVVRLLPQPYNTYRVTILAGGAPIEELIPQVYSGMEMMSRTWATIDYNGNPWVTPLSRPVNITHGLQGRHLALWASHGRYYDNEKMTWKWQRPRLYCTTEDIFTQSFVVPFLIPMLENAGAVVYTPRERDWQREEVIVDNNTNTLDGSYKEITGQYGWTEGAIGFAQLQDFYLDHENPFTTGTFRLTDAQTGKRLNSQVVWQPHLSRAGKYAVYVSYASLPTSVSDAEYTVYHRGIATKFRVNQQMGGGTWVYLGTFDFAEGSSPENCVMLSNQSNYRGVVTADAVRFGGGTGNIARGDSIHSFVRSGFPRYLEGSRYFAQWAGMPYEIYGTKESGNDYAEDINARSLTVNKLARGSVFLPGDSGLCVPIELSLAVHSDAGFARDSSLIATLGIYTTGKYTAGKFDGLIYEGLFPSLRSRLMSRDLCDMVMTQVESDLQQLCGKWVRRQMYDRNYSETRLPEVPSMILETLSHQNFADLLRGHDPTFKMLLSRAIYKGVLKYTASVHEQPNTTVVQPLPVNHFSAILNARGDSVELSWRPVADPTDIQAIPDSYIVYSSEGDKGYDNGQVTYTNTLRLPVNRGKLTRFIVRAANVGGISLPSEELCVYSARHEQHRLLIVNGFNRLAGPQPIDDENLRGFDFNIDPGVVYQHSPSYCGRQQYFDKNGFNGSGTTELGYSGDEFENMIIAGNTFDFPTLHAKDFLLNDTTLSISSCSHTVLEQGLSTSRYHALDLILGAQRADRYSMNAQNAFSPELSQVLSAYGQNGGSLLVSGAYISEDITQEFAERVLHLSPAGPYSLDESSCQMTGLNTTFSIYYEPNEERYSIRRLSSFVPTADAFTSVTDSQKRNTLAVAYQGTTHRTLTYGFPLECIREPEVRRAVMKASLTFILNK